MNEDKFNKWYDKNESKLVENWNNDNLDLGILDDDMPNIPNRSDFQEWTEEEYIRVMKGGWEVRYSQNKLVSSYLVKYFKSKSKAQNYANEVKRNKGMYYRIIPNENIIKHSCGRIIDSEAGCLMCEKISGDI